jgi:hypothetical protein
MQIARTFACSVLTMGPPLNSTATIGLPRQASEFYTE